jgi:disulfide bond formation protein DsbB
MTPEALLATNILVYATLGIDIAIVVLVFGVIFFRIKLFGFFARWNMCMRCLATLVALCALFGSMIYGAVTGFAPCALCLTSRALMGLIVLTLPIPLFLKGKEQAVLLWGKIFATLGILVSFYQYVLQWLALTGTHLPCPAIEGLPSCDRIYFIEFGFITIPFVALSAFALILILLFLHRPPTSGTEGV